MDRCYCVYLLTNYTNTAIYTGVTGDLLARVQQHRDKVNLGFTSRYNVWKLVHYEMYEDASSAIVREKQIKGGSRADKMALIAKENPRWRDLWWDLVGEPQSGGSVASR